MRGNPRRVCRGSRQLGSPLRGEVWEYVQGCDRTALRHNLGLVSNDTLNAVERGLREFLNLP